MEPFGDRLSTANKTSKKSKQQHLQKRGRRSSTSPQEFLYTAHKGATMSASETERVPSGLVPGASNLTVLCARNFIGA